MLNNTDLETEPKLDLDRRFKRCILECLYIWLAGEKVGAGYRKAVGKNILGLLGEIDTEDLTALQRAFGATGQEA